MHLAQNIRHDEDGAPGIGSIAGVAQAFIRHIKQSSFRKQKDSRLYRRTRETEIWKPCQRCAGAANGVPFGNVRGALDVISRRTEPGLQGLAHHPGLRSFSKIFAVRRFLSSLFMLLYCCRWQTTSQAVSFCTDQAILRGHNDLYMIKPLI
jgi:hypothetical protein